MKKSELKQILALALGATLSVQSVSYAQEATQPSIASDIENLHDRLKKIPISGAATSAALKAAQDAAAQSEAAAAAIVGLPAVDPNSGKPPAPENGAQPSNLDDGGQAKGGAGGDTGISELEGFLEPFIYDDNNRRDPFLAYGVTTSVAGTDSEAPRILSPIQKYPLSDFTLIGVLWDVKSPKAMVQTGTQELFVIGRDESIGIDHGYVAAIREGEIVVVEPVKKRGDVTYKTTVLRMER